MPKKKDFILIGVLLAIAIIGLIIVHIMQSGSGATVTVYINGVVHDTYALNKNQIIEIDNEEGYNKIVIENKEVRMHDADCPDQYCVNHAPISHNHETITCLPHRLVVEITGGTSSDIDVISQ